MVNYQLGKIYKIVDNTNDNVYIGSTCEPTLARRLAKHLGNYKEHQTNGLHYVSSFKIFENENYDIVLIELCSCNSKDELYSRERYWIQHFGDSCINMQRNPGRQFIPGAIDEYHKNYREINKEK